MEESTNSKLKSENVPKAIPFITYSPSEGFSLTKESESFLSSLSKERKIGIVSIVGKYRTGKSFFVNRVLLNSQKTGFKVGSTVNACTKGLWLWTYPLKVEGEENSDMDVLVIDTEGFGGTDENVNHDNKIFIFSLLLSSYFIFNSVGHIDENALNNLSLIINLAKEIQTKATSAQQGEEIVNSFPSFLWVVRDFALRLVDKEGNPIKPKDYLEQALELQKGVSDSTESKNRMRRMFKHFFKDRDCITLIRPCEKESDLQKIEEIMNDGLRTEFVNQMKLARQKILKKTKPKVIREKQLNGSMLVELSKAYIEAINKGGVPNIENAWKYIVKNESYKHLKESLIILEEEISKLREKKFVEFDERRLKELKHSLYEKLMANFRRYALGEESELKDSLVILKKEFKEKFEKFEECNKENILQSYSDYSKDKLEEIEEKIRSEKYTNYFEFQADFNVFMNEFDSKFSNGLQKKSFMLEISSKFSQIAAENLLKKSELAHDKTIKILRSRCEMLEGELEQKKQLLEEENENLNTELEGMINEKAMMEVNMKNLNAKLRTINEENNVLVMKYESLQAKCKGDENEFTFKYDELKSELEQKFNDIKEEYTQIQNENEKRIALLEQENHFLQRENEGYLKELDSKQSEINGYKVELETSAYENESLKKELTALEALKQKELISLKNEFEKKMKEMIEFNSEKRVKTPTSQDHSEFLIEKTYLENQINLLNSQLQENKKMYDALYLALQQNIKTQELDTDELLETNKNLSKSVETMTLRCKAQEEKIQRLKIYKQFYKGSSAFKCLLCSSVIPNHSFLRHVSKCNENLKSNNSIMNLSKSNVSIPNLDSHKKNIREYKASIRDNQKKHQSIHYDNEYNQRRSPKGGFDFFEFNDLQIELEDYIVNHEERSCTEFIVKCTCHQFVWKIQKKYVSFCELYQNIVLAFPGLVLPDSCKIFTNSNNSSIFNYHGDILREKQIALQSFIQDLAKIDFIKNSVFFRNFLEVQENMINYLKREKSQNDKKNYFVLPEAKNHQQDSENLVDSIEMVQSKIIDSLKKDRNSMNFNDYLDKSIDFVNDFDENLHSSGVLGNKDVQNSTGSNNKKNTSICLNIDKSLLPVSPKTYLKKWGSEIKSKSSLHQRRISDKSPISLIASTQEDRIESNVYSHMFTNQNEGYSKENTLALSHRVKTQSKTMTETKKIPLSSKKNTTERRKSSQSKTPIEMMKNLVTYIKGI